VRRGSTTEQVLRAGGHEPRIIDESHEGQKGQHRAEPTKERKRAR